MRQAFARPDCPRPERQTYFGAAHVFSNVSDIGESALLPQAGSVPLSTLFLILSHKSEQQLATHVHVLFSLRYFVFEKAKCEAAAGSVQNFSQIF